MLGDWLLLPLRGDALLAVSGTTRLAVVLEPAAPRALPAALVRRLDELLEAIGVPRALREREARAMRWAEFAPVRDGVLLSAGELLRNAALDPAMADAHPTTLAVALGQLQVGSPFAGDGVPIRAAHELFGLPPERGDLQRALAEAWMDGASPD